MKNLLRLMTIAAVVLIVLFVLDSPINENDTLQGPQKMEPLPEDRPVDVSLGVPRPTEGVSVYIGNSAEEWLEVYGEPSRKEPSAYGYEWWVYEQSLSRYVMAGVKEDKVVQVYAAGSAADPAPFEIGQKLEDLYRFTIIENEISVEFGDNVYTFHLNENDIKNRLLVKFDEVYAQLYIDSEDQILEAVRFTDAETLIRHEPYDMLYTGELLPSENPSSSLQQSVDIANARQIRDLSNVYRVRHERRPLTELPLLNAVAWQNSRDTAKRSRTGEEAEEPASLSERLSHADIPFAKAAENTASQYYDAAEAVHGWLNSSEHRDTLLSKEFTHTGTGAYGKFYTQDFIRREPAQTVPQ